MLTPKEKAKELVNKFREYANDEYHECKDQWELNEARLNNAKKCAKIAVDEIIESSPRYPSNVDWDECGGTHQYYYEAQRIEAEIFWNVVKLEIENL